MEQAIFAAGCFWGVQYYFDQVPGVTGTTVGYTGGTTEDPTYEEVCSHTTGHAEAVLVEYDVDAVIAGGTDADGVQGAGEKRTEPHNGAVKGASQPATQQSTASNSGVGGSASKSVIAFRILLRQFFRMHDPTQLNRQGPDVGDNYRSAIFYVTDEQKAVAERVMAELQPKFDEPIVTEITPAGPFYRAEEYHQKYTEKTGHGACHVAYAPISD